MRVQALHGADRVPHRPLPEPTGAHRVDGHTVRAFFPENFWANEHFHNGLSSQSRLDIYLVKYLYLISYLFQRPEQPVKLCKRPSEKLVRAKGEGLALQLPHFPC